MTAYSEEIQVVNFSKGLYTADLASAIPDGYCAACENAIPTGTSVESRLGLQSSSVGSYTSQLSSELFGFSYLGISGKKDNPTLIWGNKSSLISGTPTISMIREGDPFDGSSGTGTINDASITSPFRSAVNYLDNIYLFLDNGVYKLTNINWSAGTFTTTLVTGSPTLGNNVPACHFKDRLWVASADTLYWTNPPASPGAVLETWNTSTNFLKVVGNRGTAVIYKIIPLGSRLYIFSSQGLFYLNVSGAPSTWTLVYADETAVVNSYQCAFERNGLIYYITLYGVYVTNGSDSIKLSGPIENYFLSGSFNQLTGGTRANTYRIAYLEGGLVASISNYYAPGLISFYDAEYSKVFYTRLSNTAWSEWQFNTNDSTGNKLIAIEAVADSAVTFINKSPVSYVMAIHSESRASGSNTLALRELMTYDGLQDKWTNQFENSVEESIRVNLETKYFTSDSPHNYKTLKYSFLEMYFSDKTKYNDNLYWGYVWQSEAAPYFAETLVEDIDISGVNFNEFVSVKLNADFKYRSVQFRLSFDTNNDTSLKVKDLYLIEHTERDGFNAIQ